MQIRLPATRCSNTHRCFALLCSADIDVSCFTRVVDCEVPLPHSRHHCRGRERLGRQHIKLMKSSSVQRVTTLSTDASLQGMSDRESRHCSTLRQATSHGEITDTCTDARCSSWSTTSTFSCFAAYKDWPRTLPHTFKHTTAT